jgi:outer membrane protein insertion porin family
VCGFTDDYVTQRTHKRDMTIEAGGARTLRLVVLCALVLASPVAGQQRQPGQQAVPVAQQIDSIDVRGNVRQSALTIIGLSGLAPGGEYNIQDLQRATKRLFSSGQFNDVQVLVKGVIGGLVTLTFEVDERALMRNVVIRGVEHANVGKIQDETDLRPGRAYSPAALEATIQMLRDELSANGIPFARIDYSAEALPDREKEIILHLDVEEGNRITIAEIIFEGNEVFDDEELAEVMNLGSEGFWWWATGKYDRERLESDIGLSLPGHYAQHGYLDFRVTNDTLIIDPNTGKTRLELTVDEGEQYFLEDFTITGNKEFSSEELEGYFRPVSTGLFVGSGKDEDEYFDQLAFQAATGDVEIKYRNEGYLYSRVVPAVVQLPPVEGEPRKVSVSWQIVEGNPAFINRVDIVGNSFTYERVIRDRINVLPGDAYSQERVIQAYQNIQALGYFVSPMEIPDIQPTETGDVNVTFRVEEQPTGSVNFGTSVGGGTGLSGFIGYTQPNLFGQGKSGSFRWDFGRFANNLTLSYSDPALFESLVSGSINFFNSSDRFITFSSGRRRRLGVGTQFGFPIPGARFTRIFAGYGISRTSFEIRRGSGDQSLFGQPPGMQSTLTLGIQRTTLNHPLFPTAGSRQSFNMDFNGGPLGGDGDFVKMTMDGTWWTPIATAGGDGGPGTGVQFAAGLTLRAGSVVGNVERFPFERFWMGGVQFGQQLRGYDETTITPLGYFPERAAGIRDISRLGNAYFSMTTEVAMRLSPQLSVATFYDAGNLFRNAREFDPTKLFRGAGFGLQLVTPFGPVGLDYAYGFDKPIPGWQLHFRLGPGF